MLFKDISGQEIIKQRLIKAVNDQRVSHTQLFLGAEGTNNLAMAIAYAQYVNCKNRTEYDSCGVCPSCVKYNNLAHPDLHFIYPVANRKDIQHATSIDYISEWRELMIEKKQLINIDDWHKKIRLESKNTIINARDCSNIIKNLSLKSYESEYRVVVIWMVERLYYSAAPKLLKILEEPPEKTLFILVAENQDLILNTIKSRTQLVKFTPYPLEELRQILINDNGLSEEKASNIAIRAEGNLRKAIIMAGEDNNKANFILFRSWLRGCFAASITQINAAVTQFSTGNREETRKFLLYAQELIRDAMLVNSGASELTYRIGEEKTFVDNVSPFIHPDVLPGFYNELNDAIFQISRYGNANIILMDLSFKMSNFLHIPNRNA